MSVDPDKLYLIRSKVCVAQSAYTPERLPLRILLYWCTGIPGRSYLNAQLVLASWQQQLLSCLQASTDASVYGCISLCQSKGVSTRPFVSSDSPLIVSSSGC